ncbi:MAG: cytochrome c [Ferruginibacter sp.]
MKKLFLVLLACSFVAFLTQCKSSSKVAATPPAAKMIYFDADVMPLVSANCSPCHIPAKGGNKEALDSYDAVKTEIGEIINRISLNPGEKGFMPFKHPKLSDSTIMVFVKWRDGGMAKSK